MLYFSIWIVVFTVSVILFYKVSGSLSFFKPNLISITFYYSLLVTCFIGALLIALNIDENYMLTRLHNNNYRDMGFYLICYIMICMPLTMLVISKWLNFKANQEYTDYLKKEVTIKLDVAKDFFLFMLILASVCIAAVMYMFLMLDKIPIIELFKGANNLGELRIEAGRGFKGNIPFRNIFAIGLPPILSLIAYVYAVGTKLLRWKLLFFVLFCVSIIVSVYDLQKAPIFFYMLMFLLTNIYIGKFRLNIKKMLLIGGLGTLFLVLLYLIGPSQAKMSQFLSYNSGPIGRLILSQIAPFYLHLELFSENMGLLMGKSLPNLALKLYHLEQVRSARIVMEVYYPEKVEQGIAGVLNTIFAGEAFANFGYLGVLIGTIYVGVFVQIIYITFIRLPKKPVYVSLFVFFTVNIPRVLVGGFTDFILNPFWVILVLLLLGGGIVIRIKNSIIFLKNLEKSNT